ncbi:MAG: hypothetical protein H6739_03690 [Alphaproteobacteria bacterium]|nr:hypothetical protein [Alphaproteobacteria bacterium]
MRTAALVLLPLLGGCAEDPYLISGFWQGAVNCGANPRMAMNLEFIPTEDELEFVSDARLTVGDQQLLFTMEVQYEPFDEGGTAVPLSVDVGDCAWSDGSVATCGPATGTLDSVAEEMSGQYSEFPISPGTCDWSQMKSL